MVRDVKVVKNFSFDPESVELLENLSDKFEKSQSEVLRDLIREKAKEIGILR